MKIVGAFKRWLGQLGAAWGCSGLFWAALGGPCLYWAFDSVWGCQCLKIVWDFRGWLGLLGATSSCLGLIEEASGRLGLFGAAQQSPRLGCSF